MNNKITFYLARHGETEWNIEHRIQGQLDSPLTLQGKAQSVQLAINCAALNITQILTSSLGRAVVTANICGEALQLKPRIVDGFEERDFGDWQGKLTFDMQSHENYTEVTSQITDCKPTNGESAKQLLTRFQDALKVELNTNPEEISLMIIHGDILRCFMNQFIEETTLNTGYDYKNAQLIALNYDLESECFSLL